MGKSRRKISELKHEVDAQNRIEKIEGELVMYLFYWLIMVRKNKSRGCSGKKIKNSLSGFNIWSRKQGNKQEMKQTMPTKWMFTGTKTKNYSSFASVIFHTIIPDHLGGDKIVIKITPY